jgi:hypothetical protein
MDKIKNEEHIYHQGQVFSHGKYISLTAAIIDLCKRKVVWGGGFSMMTMMMINAVTTGKLFENKAQFKYLDTEKQNKKQ